MMLGLLLWMMLHAQAEMQWRVLMDPPDRVLAYDCPACTNPPEGGWTGPIDQPVDVPAIVRQPWCDNGAIRYDPIPNNYKSAGSGWCSGDGHATATCADKSRVLLTSEDGKKHCIKF